LYSPTTGTTAIIAAVSLILLRTLGVAVQADPSESKVSKPGDQI
jgi:hypothetical protein